MDDELRRLAQETIDETDSTDWAEWRSAAKQLARKVLEMGEIIDRWDEIHHHILQDKNAEIKRLREALEDVEWIFVPNQNDYCPWCGGWNNEDGEKEPEYGHSPDCLRQRALHPQP